MQSNTPPFAEDAGGLIGLSLIAPAHNEEENILGLVNDVRDALDTLEVEFEMIIVDDGSTDRTSEIVGRLMGEHSWLRGVTLPSTPERRGNGQSAAFYVGIRQARGQLIALLDADRQNDPADLPAMIEMLSNAEADMVQGDRTADRQDSAIKRASSVVGWVFRRGFLGDTVRDTGCSLRVFKRSVGLALPLQFSGMHRFIPVYAHLLGYRVVETPVHHRGRIAGQSKYGALSRALPGLRDLFAVRWMRSRFVSHDFQPISPRVHQHVDKTWG